MFIETFNFLIVGIVEFMDFSSLLFFQFVEPPNFKVFFELLNLKPAHLSLHVDAFSLFFFHLDQFSLEFSLNLFGGKPIFEGAHSRILYNKNI